MLVPKHQSLTVTLVLSLVLGLTLAGPSEAKSFARSSIHNREHANLKRMFKKRAPFPQTGTTGSTRQPLIQVVGAGSDPNSITGSVSVTPPSPTSSDAVAPSSSSLALSSSIPLSSASVGASSSSVSISASISSISSSAPSSSSTPSSSIPAPSSPGLNLSMLPSLSVADSPAVVTKTASVTAAQAGETAPPVTAAAKKKSNVLTILIAIAASVGGVVIIWTIFRKWKLARSSKFDQRLQPIDWQPTNPDDSPSIHRRATSETSFQSGSVHDNTAGRGVGAYGATGHGSDHGHGSDYGHNPISDHDFTAGSNLAPVGGYADLARGPSPQPQMQQALGRGPSLTRPAYEVGVPLHHQAGYAEAYDYNGDRVRF